MLGMSWHPVVPVLFQVPEVAQCPSLGFYADFQGQSGHLGDWQRVTASTVGLYRVMEVPPQMFPKLQSREVVEAELDLTCCEAFLNVPASLYKKSPCPAKSVGYRERILGGHDLGEGVHRPGTNQLSWWIHWLRLLPGDPGTRLQETNHQHVFLTAASLQVCAQTLVPLSYHIWWKAREQHTDDWIECTCCLLHFSFSSEGFQSVSMLVFSLPAVFDT